MDGFPRRKPWLRGLVLRLTDIFIVLSALACALMCRFEGRIPAKDLGRFLRWFWVIVLIYAGLFSLTGMYRVRLRNGGYREMLILFLASVGGVIGTLLFNLLSRVGLSRGTLILTGVFTFSILVCSRYAWILLRNVLMRDLVSRTHKRALVIDAGPKGRNLVKALKRPIDDVYHEPVVFVSGDVDAVYRTCEGVPIEGMYGDIPALVLKYSVDEILLSARPASRKLGFELLGVCVDARVPAYRPSVDKGEITGIRPLALEDMVYIPPFEPKEADIAAKLAGKSVLVAGAGGSVGAKLCEWIQRFYPARLILLDSNESNLSAVYEALRRSSGDSVVPILCRLPDEDRLTEIFARYSPEIVFHCAGGKSQSVLERNRAFAVENELRSTGALLRAARESGAKRFAYLSSDLAESRKGVLGAVKRMAERLVCDGDENGGMLCVAARFGSILEPNGELMSRFESQIASGGPIVVPKDSAARHFVTFEDAAGRILHAALTAEESGVYRINLGEPISAARLAELLARMKGKKPGEDIEIQVAPSAPGETEEARTAYREWTEESAVFEKETEVREPLPAPYTDTPRMIELLDAILTE